MRSPCWFRPRIFFISVALLTQVLSVAATYFGEQVGWGATNVLRADLALHCLNLDLPFHHKHTPGEMIERIDSDITALANLFSQLVIRILGNFLLMLGVLVVVWLEDWRVGAVLSLFSIVAFLVLNWFSDRAVPHFTAEREANANLYGFLEERLNALEDVRANGGGAYAMQRFFHWMRELYGKGRTAGMFGASLWLVTNVLFTIGILIVFGSGAYLFQAGIDHYRHGVSVRAIHHDAAATVGGDRRADEGVPAGRSRRHPRARSY